MNINIIWNFSEMNKSDENCDEEKKHDLTILVRYKKTKERKIIRRENRRFEKKRRGSFLLFDCIFFSSFFFFSLETGRAVSNE